MRRLRTIPQYASYIWYFGFRSRSFILQCHEEFSKTYRYSLQYTEEEYAVLDMLSSLVFYGGFPALTIIRLWWMQ